MTLKDFNSGKDNLPVAFVKIYSLTLSEQLCATAFGKNPYYESRQHGGTPYVVAHHMFPQFTILLKDEKPL